MCLRAFAAGCLGVSWVGTVGAVLVCSAIYLTLALAVTSDRFAAAPQRFMSSKLDSYPLLKAAALQIAADPKPSRRTYRVVLIGDSGLREAMTSVPDLRRRIQAQVHRHVEITPLLAGGLSQLDAVDLCGLLRGHMHGRVLLEVSPYWVAKELDTEMFDRVADRLGLDSPDLLEEYTAAHQPRPRWWDNFALRNRRFLLAHSQAFVLGLSPRADPPWHDPHLRGAVSDPVFAHDAARIRGLMHGIAHRSAQNLAVYRRMIARLQSAGIEVTLVEPPLNARLFGRTASSALNDRVMRVYSRARRQLGLDAHVGCWKMTADAALTPADFHDAYHVIRPAARQRFTVALAAHVAKAINAARTHA